MGAVDRRLQGLGHTRHEQVTSSVVLFTWMCSIVYEMYLPVAPFHIKASMQNYDGSECIRIDYNSLVLPCRM